MEKKVINVLDYINEEDISKNQINITEAIQKAINEAEKDDEKE